MEKPDDSQIMAITIAVIGAFMSMVNGGLEDFVVVFSFLGGWAFAYFAGYSLTEPAQYASALLCTIASLVLLLMGRMIVKE